MRIPRRGLAFDTITFHEKVTQCLGGLGADPWFLVVAEPTGSVGAAPGPEQLHAFQVRPTHVIACGIFLRYIASCTILCCRESVGWAWKPVRD